MWEHERSAKLKCFWASGKFDSWVHPLETSDKDRLPKHKSSRSASSLQHELLRTSPLHQPWGTRWKVPQGSTTGNCLDVVSQTLKLTTLVHERCTQKKCYKKCWGLGGTLTNLHGAQVAQSGSVWCSASPCLPVDRVLQIHQAGQIETSPSTRIPDWWICQLHKGHILTAASWDDASTRFQ